MRSIGAQVRRVTVPENAQFVCSRLAALAASTGASVIVSHHFTKREASTPEQAREAIRGTGGLVDGVRSVYALWNPKEMDAKTICKTLGESFERGRVVMGSVVKANGRANLKVATFLRDTRGNDETQCLRYFPGSRWVLSKERVSIVNASPHSTWLVWLVRHKHESCQILPNRLILSHEHNEHIPTRHAQVLRG